MKVRLACVDDLNEIMELYHLVSDDVVRPKKCQ